MKTKQITDGQIKALAEKIARSLFTDPRNGVLATWLTQSSDTRPASKVWTENIAIAVIAGGLQSLKQHKFVDDEPEEPCGQ